ncbi:cytochrome C' [Comamonas serinivorans]|uniref:Cytochrome C n=1 Tax=Comamonas serinivorans TaxID=1082851 RepID=A0A1Y0EP99_9BURK|nr:c-type cytochrome [Comamonas serinivorans]ARU05149.1 cytochrome C' [Comamonas serinivorans]
MKKTLVALGALVLAAAPAMADEALAKAKNCMACHAVDKKVVGPSYKDVARKYQGDAAAVSKLTTKILKGSSGVWGAVPMPANAAVSEADAKKLSEWIVNLK